MGAALVDIAQIVAVWRLWRVGALVPHALRPPRRTTGLIRQVPRIYASSILFIA